MNTEKEKDRHKNNEMGTSEIHLLREVGDGVSMYLVWQEGCYEISAAAAGDGDDDDEQRRRPWRR